MQAGNSGCDITSTCCTVQADVRQVGIMEMCKWCIGTMLQFVSEPWLLLSTESVSSKRTTNPMALLEYGGWLWLVRSCCMRHAAFVKLAYPGQVQRL